MPDCGGFDWNFFLDKYGIPGALLVVFGFFFWREIWPASKNFLAELVLELKNISNLLKDIAPALKTLTDATKDHEANTRQALDEIRSMAAKAAGRRRV